MSNASLDVCLAAAAAFGWLDTAEVYKVVDVFHEVIFNYGVMLGLLINGIDDVAKTSLF